ncbi:MAG: hypothetical protein J1F35_05580 [Erysipelotrichales bacterium]|nr:hypothetical protein [Erysipelotrichales bacterium]
MKRDRNSFFSQFGSYGYNSQPNMPNMNMNTMPQNNYNQDYDIDSRLSKIERELNRMDARLSKLEQSTMAPQTNNTDFNFANSMYMV